MHYPKTPWVANVPFEGLDTRVVGGLGRHPSPWVCPSVISLVVELLAVEYPEVPGVPVVA